MRTAITDRKGNLIGNGEFHAEYEVMNLGKYPQVSVSVSESETTESVYVTYTNKENYKSITCRFSWHDNNAVRWGDQLNGYIVSDNEILYHLGLINRRFIPATRKYICTRSISKKDLAAGVYDECDKTIQELYDLPVGTDISQYNGMLAKNSRYLVQDNTIHEYELKTTDAFGNNVRLGRYEYFN